MAEKTIGVIGGTGLYEIEGLEKVEEVEVDTPFGPPSDNYIVGTLEGARMVFLSRHGRGHRFLPSEVNYRANIFGMKKLGVDHIISVSACGSMKHEIEPGHIVVIDQFIDRTKGRPSTFYGNGIVVHVAFADPICKDLASILYQCGRETGAVMHMGGTYLCMEGPQFSTRAESHTYRSWGVDVIGMTNVPEAKLAREAEICYATLALSTDYDCWREPDEDVSIDSILTIMKGNVERAKKIIRAAVPRIPEKRACACATALQYTIITDPAMIPDSVKADLDTLVGKYLDKGEAE